MKHALYCVLLLAACKGADGMPLVDASTGGADAAQMLVEVRGFTATVESFQCTPPGQTSRQCGAYRTSFVIHDKSQTETVMRLERLKISHANGLNVATSIHCGSAPWMIAANSMSPIIDVTFDFRGGPNDGGWPAWAVPCGTSSLTPEIIDDIGAGPTSGEFVLTASLRMSGGSMIDLRAAAQLTPF